MARSPWQAGTMLLALAACVAPAAETPTETPTETPAETPAAPVQEAVVTAPEGAVVTAPEEAAAPQPAAVQPAVIEPAAPAAVKSVKPAAVKSVKPAAVKSVTPEAPLDPETLAIIETAIAALSPPETAAPEAVAPEAVAPEEPPTPEAPVIEAAPEPDIDDDPEQLMGLAGGALTELLGDPGFRREDADAQVWQYRGRNCVLDIYLYRDGEALPHRVTYFEFRGDGGERPCLRDLILAQAG